MSEQASITSKVSKYEVNKNKYISLCFFTLQRDEKEMRKAREAEMKAQEKASKGGK